MWVYIWTSWELKNAYIWEWVDVISLTLDKSSISLTTVWQTEQITATTVPAWATVTWSSSDTTVATVDSTWLVTCVSAWTCTITAESFGVTAICGVTDGSWWQPWINTVAYYEFDNDLTDSSGNNHDLTVQSWSVAYWTASWGGKYSYWNTSTYTTNMALKSINYDTDSYTISFYRQPKTIFSSWAHAVFDLAINGYDPLWMRVTDSISFWGGTGYVATVDTWYHVAMVRNINAFSVYINWSLRTTFTFSQSWTRTPSLRINAIWNATSLTNNNYLWEFIIEDKGWTALEIASYFNSTKSLYGIS